MNGTFCHHVLSSSSSPSYRPFRIHCKLKWMAAVLLLVEFGVKLDGAEEKVEMNVYYSHSHQLSRPSGKHTHSKHCLRISSLWCYPLKNAFSSRETVRFFTVLLASIKLSVMVVTIILMLVFINSQNLHLSFYPF